MGVTVPGPSGEVLEQYEVSNSLRFNDDDSAYLEKDFSSDGSRQKFTWSAWIKRSTLGANQVPFGAAEATGRDEIRLNSSDQFQVFFGDASDANLITDRVFRDVSAWYHFVVAVDTTNATANNRIRVYVNGVEETSFGTRSNPSENYQMDFTADCPHRLGVEGSGTSLDFDGYMTEVNFVDGQQYDPTYFGRFNENNVWVPKRYTGTYGTNGFFLEFKQTGTSANSSGMGADTSGNDHHFTPNNLAATDVTEDTCTNNFATMNPLESDRQQGGAATFAEGNLQITTSYVDANYQRYPQVYSTQAASSGKWYFEMKIADSDTDSAMGIHSPDNYSSDSTTNPYGGYATTSCIYTSRGAVRINDGNNTGHGTWSQNDIIGCALDIDNSKVYFHKNGTYIQSGDPAGNSGGQAIPSGYTYGFTVGADAASDSGIMQVNFGNPIHTISSGNTDGKYGNFEYAVPSGFYAVCTKRLAEFG